MSKKEIPRDIQYTDLIRDNPFDAICAVRDWMIQDDGYGRTNLFYFLDMSLNHEPELGWCATIYHGKVIKHRVGSAKKRRKTATRPTP